MPDRDRLIELINQKVDSVFFKAEELADYLLENDVIVQKQGKWISAPIKDKGYDSKTIPTCTNCGYQSFITYTHCPECGARLKESDQNAR